MDEIEQIANGNVLFLNSLTGVSPYTSLQNASVENGSGSTIKITPKGSVDGFGFCWKQIKEIRSATFGVIPLPTTKNAMIRSLVENVFVDPSAGGTGVQDIIDILEGTDTSILSGNVEIIDLLEVVGAGAKVTPLGKLSVAVEFNGTGGTFNGIIVPNGFRSGWSGTFRNEVSSKGFTVPTVANSGGFMRVLISTTEI